MAEVPRGVIRDRMRGTQCRDFSGLRFGNITATDIDGLIEYKNKGYIFIEAKYEDAELPYGQRLALMRLCDDLQKVKPTLLVIASHNANRNEDIDVAASAVTEFRFKGEWRHRETTTGELVTAFVGHLDGLWTKVVD